MTEGTDLRVCWASLTTYIVVIVFLKIRELEKQKFKSTICNCEYSSIIIKKNVTIYKILNLE